MAMKEFMRPKPTSELTHTIQASSLIYEDENSHALSSRRMARSDCLLWLVLGGSRGYITKIQSIANIGRIPQLLARQQLGWSFTT